MIRLHAAVRNAALIKPKWLHGLPVIVAIAATAALALPDSATAAAPANDDVQNAQVITTESNGGFWEASITDTNGQATAQTSEPRGMDPLGSDRSTVWYSWTPFYSSSSALIEVCAGFQTVLGIFTKNGDPVPPFSNLTDHGAMEAGEAGSCPFDRTQLGFLGGFETDGSQTYYFQVAGLSGSGPMGTFTLKLEEFPPDSPFPPDATPPAAPLTTPAVKKKCKHSRSVSAAKKKKCKQKGKK